MEFKCLYCVKSYKRRSNLNRHMKVKHAGVSIKTRTRGAGKECDIQYKCQHCGSSFSNRSNLDRHVKLAHGQSFTCTLCGKTCTRSLNLEMHMRTCTGSSTPAHWGGAASCSSTPAHIAASSTQTRRGGATFTVQRKRKALGGAVEVHSVDMNEANQLVALENAVVALGPTMTAFQQTYNAYKYQIAINIVFHKAVDPAVITDPPVALRSTMVAVYAADASQLEETAAHLLELVEVYEHNGSGWVFSNFVSMELTLWHLGPLRASAFVPLPKWIRDKRAVTNVIGTGNDCFKWAVLAVLHPVAKHPNRQDSYLQFADMYEFETLTFPVPLQAIVPFARKSSMFMHSKKGSESSSHVSI